MGEHCMIPFKKAMLFTFVLVSTNTIFTFSARNATDASTLLDAAHAKLSEAQGIIKSGARGTSDFAHALEINNDVLTLVNQASYLGALALKQPISHPSLHAQLTTRFTTLQNAIRQLQTQIQSMVIKLIPDTPEGWLTYGQSKIDEATRAIENFNLRTTTIEDTAKVAKQLDLALKSAAAALQLARTQNVSPADMSNYFDIALAIIDNATKLKERLAASFEIIVSKTPSTSLKPPAQQSRPVLHYQVTHAAPVHS
jgi:hypothetical protein